MHDALLIYFLIASMRHAGYFRVVANFIRWAKAQYASLLPVICTPVPRVGYQFVATGRRL